MKKLTTLLLVILSLTSFAQNTDEQFTTSLKAAQDKISAGLYPVAYLEKAERIKPNDPQLHLVWGKYLYKEKEWKNCYSHLSKYLTTKSDDTAAIKMRAYAGLHVNLNRRSDKDTAIYKVCLADYTNLIDNYHEPRYYLDRGALRVHSAIDKDQACEDFRKYEQLYKKTAASEDYIKQYCK